MSMKLIVLGILMEGQKHPYDMQQIMVKRNMSRYIKLQKGSLYYAVEQLTKNGLTEVVDVVKDGSHPYKTIYRITEAGVEEFHKLLLEQFLNHDKVYNPLHAGLAFVYHGNQSRIAEMLENRIEKLESNLVLMQKEYANMVPFVPRSALYIIVSAIEHGKTELKLLCNLLDDARNNRLGESGQLFTLGIHE
ncbi:PadR family transcriptional regulator [Sporomusa aerivorans]|uniref:PadR family transcriptional regulator n=1 Tax=Sporomusa aerivorans TaxID=204936 RepID=UPI00352B2EB8